MSIDASPSIKRASTLQTAPEKNADRASFTKKPPIQRLRPGSTIISFTSGKPALTKPSEPKLSMVYKGWQATKGVLWRSYQVVDEAMSALNVFCGRIALLSMLVIPFYPQSWKNFIEVQTFYAPLKSCDRSLIRDEKIRNKLETKRVLTTLPDGKRVEVEAWYILADEGKPTILLSHGRHMNISNMEKYFKVFSEKGYGVFAYDYPGFGNSQGKVSKEACYASGIASAKYLRDRCGVGLDKMIVMGYSLGTNVSANIIEAMKDPDFRKPYNDPDGKEKGLQEPKALVLINGFSTLEKAFDSQKRNTAKKLHLQDSTKIGQWGKAVIDKVLQTDKMPDSMKELNTEKTLESALSKIENTHTFIFNGEKDEQVACEDAEAMFKKLDLIAKEKVHFHAYEDMKHSPKQEHLEKILAFVEKALNVQSTQMGSLPQSASKH